mgnify:CR=1 FL=1|tara:strand:+ start:2722 stop:3171 length:450 start_codon:yes stop_codon:yes gene_type:complete
MDSQETQKQALTNSFEAIEDALDVDTLIQPEGGCTTRKAQLVNVSTEQHLQKDYEYSRAQLYNLVEKGQEAVNGILDVAQQSDQPRAYEVAGQLIKHVGDVADKLADLHKKVNEIENPKKSATKEITNNTMFVGSTAELSKFLKQKQDK